ncbi:MAG: hypothetical protein WC747_01945 [Candidatus Babeliales bacterium]|jgi:hypothetical protein
MKKLLCIFMSFFSSYQVSLGFDRIAEFIERIPKDSMVSLQNDLHATVKKLNGNKKNKGATQKVLISLHESLTYEIKYLESQIKNKYSFDRRALKKTLPSLMIAAACTYGMYYFYKKSARVDRAIADIENKWIQENIKRSDYWDSWNSLHRNKIKCKDQVLFASGITSCSYLVLLVYAHNAYTLDPNRNNELVSKYQQLLKLVELIQEVQA